jgi:hypothetical protein
MFKSLILTLILGCGVVLAQDRPILESETNLSRTGHFRLSWKLGENSDDREISFIVQQSSEENFNNPKLIYTGLDQQSFLSGLDNGRYFYRVGTAESENEMIWSGVTMVEVRHYPLSMAYSLFVLGAVVFISTTVMVVKGSSKSQAFAS